MTVRRTEPLRRGDLVSYESFEYVVASTNREGKIRLLGAQEGAPPVPKLLAPSRVTVRARGPRLRVGGKPAIDRARIVGVGTLLRETREALGYTTRRLADQIGVSATYLNRAEMGSYRSPPSATYLARFAEVTGADELELCAAAGVIPHRISAALTDLGTLKAVDLLITKLKGHTP